MLAVSGVEAEYRVQVTDFCYVLPSYTHQNDIIFLEGARDANGNITTLRIRSMTEGRPIDRYMSQWSFIHNIRINYFILNHSSFSLWN